MTWWTATSVSVNNGATIVNVNTGDDVQIAQEAGGLVIGNQPPVEIKRTYLDGSNNKKIELRLPWPYAAQTAQPAVAFPTDADLAEATKVLRAVGDSAIEASIIATQAEAEAGSNNSAKMTPLRTAQAVSSRIGTTGNLGNAALATVTTSSTDTTAGRLLKVGDGGLLISGSLQNTFANNANNVDISCTLNTSATWEGSPFAGTAGGNQGYLKTSRWVNTAYLMQEFFNVNSAWRKFTRRKDNGVWSEWVPDYNARNILGTVSQTAGTPTGAIIQRGSNANGEFVRFADGTQICTKFFATGQVSIPANEQVTISTTETFPIAFAAIPAVSLTNSGGFSARYHVGVEGTSTTTWASGSGVALRNLDGVTRDVIAILSFIAIGRWF